MDVYRREVMAAMVVASLTVSIWLSVSGIDEALLPSTEPPVMEENTSTEPETNTTDATYSPPENETEDNETENETDSDPEDGSGIEIRQPEDSGGGNRTG